MRASWAGSLSRRKFWFLSALGVTVLTTLCIASAVSADAPDPVPAAATITLGPVTNVNGVPTRTVTAAGQWQWPTHGSDCNTDRAGAGFAVDWNDPNQAGNHVTTLPAPVGSVDVGAAAANAY